MRAFDNYFQRLFTEALEAADGKPILEAEFGYSPEFTRFIIGWIYSQDKRRIKYGGTPPNGVIVTVLDGDNPLIGPRREFAPYINNAKVKVKGHEIRVMPEEILTCGFAIEIVPCHGNTVNVFVQNCS